mmetsp:Transcript_2340/g.4030  ORF Transcript_2340/g.4030 Transcript_2340/m.4030 type:complete len:257 (-) Transcript_2340:798-1568(-)
MGKILVSHSYASGEMTLIAILSNSYGHNASHCILLSEKPSTLQRLAPVGELWTARDCPFCIERGVLCECSARQRLVYWNEPGLTGTDWGSYVSTMTRRRGDSLNGLFRIRVGHVDYASFGIAEQSYNDFSAKDKMIRAYATQVHIETLSPRREILWSNAEDVRPTSESLADGRKLCEHCGRSFFSLSTLYRHIRSIHRGEKVECQDCGQSFSSRWNLKRHHRTMHSESQRCPNMDLDNSSNRKFPFPGPSIDDFSS